MGLAKDPRGRLGGGPLKNKKENTCGWKKTGAGGAIKPADRALRSKVRADRPTP